jgi:3-dehydroquinate dehydratase
MGSKKLSRGIVTLCGSVRFKAEFEQMNKELTLANWIVLAPGAFVHDWLHSGMKESDEKKKRLDRLHREKISMSDSIVVINPGGYVGKSTQHEIDYAISIDKQILWLNPPNYHDGAIGRSWKEMIE